MTEQNDSGSPAEPTEVPQHPEPAPPVAPAAPKDRRKLFAFLRWTTALAVFAGAGTGVAYAIVQPERTEIPGLSTQHDGRWVYPALALPALPPGAALPSADDNPGGIHYAGLTQLLLPAPEGSKPDAALKLEKDSRVTTEAFLEEYEAEARETVTKHFLTDGPREIVARGWTMPDGTRTRIYLLRFHSSGFVAEARICTGQRRLNGVHNMPLDLDWTKAKSAQSMQGNNISLYKEGDPVGDEQTALGCIASGDVQAVILQNRKGEVATVPFHQTVILQKQLLD
ncbi:hypothetical protein OG264_21375 [Streptomyces xanthophaeus]|uniref:hypothetical protein n=1 Tax=Streptomyces xanthophaeus TaxID=67385 RepID=UPI00386DDC5A|nr:hypothetical protein OG264_21375 [Streptomyces xanthophaeus]WST61208.1 hypothetical protein OG605_17070 [Streptomyces xanthophaeus]